MQRTLSTSSGRSRRDVALVRREALRLVRLERRRRGALVDVALRAR